MELKIRFYRIMSSYQVHVEQLLSIFGYMKKIPKLSLCFDPRLTSIDSGIFSTNAEDFKDYYRDSEEEIPHRIPLYLLMKKIEFLTPQF